LFMMSILKDSQFPSPKSSINLQVNIESSPRANPE
jgi:hypothetical protein